ncbi:MAG TPA: nitroreductase family protein [Cyclobacteriaceae bacterium]|nr:nitroreductase family protein [Cyclobacteriaceae bacterium]
MEKSHVLAYPVSDLIKNRRSIRSFSGEPVSEGQMRSLFEATRWAPSSTNEQPWYYLYVTRDQNDLWEIYIDCLNEGNKIWAKGAALLIFSMARKRFTRYEADNPYAMYDLGGANSFLAIQAVELGLQVRQMAGFNHAKAKAVLHIPDSFEPGVFIAVGYPGDVASLPEHLQVREAAPRERFVQNEFVSNGIFQGHA